MIREEVNAAMAAGGGGAAEIEDALAEMQEHLLAAAAQERQRLQGEWMRGSEAAATAVRVSGLSGDMISTRPSTTPVGGGL